MLHGEGHRAASGWHRNAGSMGQGQEQAAPESRQAEGNGRRARRRVEAVGAGWAAPKFREAEGAWTKTASCEDGDALRASRRGSLRMVGALPAALGGCGAPAGE